MVLFPVIVTFLPPLILYPTHESVLFVWYCTLKKTPSMLVLKTVSFLGYRMEIVGAVLDLPKTGVIAKILTFAIRAIKIRIKEKLLLQLLIITLCTHFR